MHSFFIATNSRILFFKSIRKNFELIREFVANKTYLIPPKAPKHMFLCKISTLEKPTFFIKSNW